MHSPIRIEAEEAPCQSCDDDDADMAGASSSSSFNLPGSPPPLQTIASEEQLLTAALRSLSVSAVNMPSTPLRNPNGAVSINVPESPFNSQPASQSASQSASRRSTPAPSPTPHSSTGGSPKACSICLSPVQTRRRFSNSFKRESYKTKCCHNVFHKDCLQRHKEQACASPATGIVRPRACPLCRSVAPTGLTPSTRPQANRAGGVGGGGGFVSGLALHSEMVRRAAAARNAVQRSLLRASGQLTSPSRAASGPPQQPRVVGGLQQPQYGQQAQHGQPQLTPGASSGGGAPTFFSPGLAYTSIVPPRHGQQLEGRFQIAEEQEAAAEAIAAGVATTAPSAPSSSAEEAVDTSEEMAVDLS